MDYLYYPGCTLKTKAKELDAAAKSSLAALCIDIMEIDDWQCCGAVYPQAQDEIAPRLSAVRLLARAKQENRALLTLCSACHHVIKRVNFDMHSNDEIRRLANNYLELEVPYAGETKVIHFLELLRDVVGFDELRKRVTYPQTGRKIGAYYGCLLLRPSSVMQYDDPENPAIMEDFIRAIGAEPVISSYRNECCGSYAGLAEKERTARLCGKITESLANKGAEVILTACPLCKYNLSRAGGLPIIYFTEILAASLGCKELGMVENAHDLP